MLREQHARADRDGGKGEATQQAAAARLHHKRVGNGRAGTDPPFGGNRRMTSGRVSRLSARVGRDQNGCRGAGIFLYRGFGTVVQNCVVRNYNGDGISFQASNDVLVENCVSENNAGLGIHPGSGSQRAVVRQCVARRNGGFEPRQALDDGAVFGERRIGAHKEAEGALHLVERGCGLKQNAERNGAGEVGGAYDHVGKNDRNLGVALGEPSKPFLRRHN